MEYAPTSEENTCNSCSHKIGWHLRNPRKRKTAELENKQAEEKDKEKEKEKDKEKEEAAQPSRKKQKRETATEEKGKEKENSEETEEEEEEKESDEESSGVVLEGALSTFANRFENNPLRKLLPGLTCSINLQKLLQSVGK